MPQLLKRYDLVVFGKSNSTNGEFTPGWITEIRMSTDGKRMKTVRVKTLTPRGRPKKPAGAIWSCHPNVIKAVLQTDNDADVIDRQLTPFEVIEVQGAIQDLKAERKEKLESWKSSLPDEQDRKKWFWKQVFPRSNEAAVHGEDWLMKIQRVNSKTVSVIIVCRQANGEFNMDRQFRTKLPGHKITIKKAFSHPATGGPEDNNDTVNPWRTQWDALEKIRNE